MWLTQADVSLKEGDCLKTPGTSGAPNLIVQYANDKEVMVQVEGMSDSFTIPLAEALKLEKVTGINIHSSTRTDRVEFSSDNISLASVKELSQTGLVGAIDYDGDKNMYCAAVDPANAEVLIKILAVRGIEAHMQEA